MRLTSFSDYALRMLMYAASNGDVPFTIDTVARMFGASKPHLSKVANTLTRGGFLKAVRGRSGGLMLARDVADVRVGDVVRMTEPDFSVVECFATGSQCVIRGRCKLSGMMGEAVDAFLATLDRYTLADIMIEPGAFGMVPPGTSPRPRRAYTRRPAATPG